MALNQITISGYTVGRRKQWITEHGMRIVRFTVACVESEFRDGKYVQVTTKVDVRAYGSQATLIWDHLWGGHEVLITGILDTTPYERGPEGNVLSGVDLCCVAFNIDVLSPRLKRKIPKTPHEALKRSRAARKAARTRKRRQREHDEEMAKRVMED